MANYSSQIDQLKKVVDEVKKTNKILSKSDQKEDEKEEKEPQKAGEVSAMKVEVQDHEKPFGALKEKLQKNNDENEESNSLLGKVAGTFKNGMESFNGGMANVAERIKGGFAKLEPKLISGFESLGKKMASIRDSLKPANIAAAFGKSLKQFFGRDFKEDFKKGLKKVGDGIKKLTGKLKDFAAGGLDKVKDVFGRLKDLAVEALLLLGTVIGFQAFLKGWEKASEWFGANADIGDRISAGLATILQSFLGLSDEQTKKIAIVFAKVADKIEEFVGGIFGGVKEIIFGLFEGDKSKIYGGLQKIIDSFAKVLFDGMEALFKMLGFDQEQIDRIIAPLIEFKDMMIPAFNDVMELGKTIYGLFTGEKSMGDLFSSLSDVLGNTFGMIDKLTKSVLAIFGFDDEYEAMKTTISNFFTGVSDILSSIGNFFMSIPIMLGDMMYAVKSNVNSLIPGESFDPFDLSEDPRSKKISVGDNATGNDVLSAIKENESLSDEEKKMFSDQAKTQMANGATAQAVVTNINNQVMTNMQKPRTRADTGIGSEFSVSS